MRKAVKIIGKILSDLILFCAVLLAVLIAGPRLLGWQSLVVLSGSMEPTYHVGSLIYVKKTAPQAVKTGEPITFYLEDGKTVVTHRVIKIDTGNKNFYTKGDANNVADGGATPYSRLIGVPVFSIPMLGYVTSYVHTRQGLILVVTGLMCFLILAFLPGFLLRKGKDGEKTVGGPAKGG